MKWLIAVAFMSLSFASQAGIKRLTSVDCSSSDRTILVEMRWDSSYSPFGTKSFKLNNKEVSGQIMQWFDNGTRYRALVDDKVFTITVFGDKKEFETEIEIAKYNQDEVNPNDYFDITGETTRLSCTYKSKLGL